MSPSLHKPKSHAHRHKSRPSAKVVSPKSSPKKAGNRARPSLKELAKEFAEARKAAGDRVLTPLQRRMMSGGV
jgi:hypothetical protein